VGLATCGKQILNIRTGESTFHVFQIEAQFFPHLSNFREFAFYGRDPFVETLQLAQQLNMYFSQRRFRIACAAFFGNLIEGPFEHFHDRSNGKPERSQMKNPCEALHVRFVIEPVTALAAFRRDEPLFFVILERACRDTQASGRLSHS